jgi:hypothetical protein
MTGAEPRRPHAFFCTAPRREQLSDLERRTGERQGRLESSLRLLEDRVTGQLVWIMCGWALTTIGIITLMAWTQPAR